MPPEARKIPQSDWDRHQSTIRAFYHNEKLPLWKQNGKRCVISVMREEHGFDASLSQYEAQLRRWDSQKNLKRQEWAFLLSQYDKLAARGCKVRIVLSGLPVLERRILRARRHLQSTGHAVHTMSAPSQAFVEYQDSRKDWIRYFSANHAPESDQPRTQVLATLGQGVSGVHGHDSSVHDADLAPLNLPQQSSASGEISLIARQEVADSTPNLVLGLRDRLHSQQSRREPGVSEDAHVSVELSRFGRPTRELRLSHPRHIIQPPQGSLVAINSSRPPYSSVDPGADIILHPAAQQIIDQLSFLTPANIEISSLGLSTRDLRSNTPTLVKAISFSVSNRTDISLRTHHQTVFGLLRQAEPLQRGLTDFLQALDPSSRECLVDNIFRHAVETGDPQATKMILEMAQSKFKYSVNPNLIKCTILERAGHFTPLEVAAVKRNVELTRVLLGVEANPNHTYWQGFEHAQGALEHALWTSVRPPDAPPVNIEVVHLLLDHQAQVRPETLQLLLRYPLIKGEIVQDVIGRIEVEHHGSYFPPNAPHDRVLRSCEDHLKLQIATLVTDIVRIFPNSTGYSSIVSFLSKCDAAVCGPCAYRHEDQISDMLKVAALRGNTDLVVFMLPMVPSAYLQELLVLAIRSGETRLVDRLLQVGATVNGPATAVITVSNFRPYEDEKLPFVKEMTPLAEAIRCQDGSLVRRLEDLGALSCIGIGKETHFRAAATAAAYAGNLTYLRKICGKGSALDVTLLSSALAAATSCDHFEIASFLLTYADTGGVASALSEAISRKNKPAFDLLVQFLGDGFENSNMMANAVKWGNIEVLDCLVRLGKDVNDDEGDLFNLPLTIAALIGDKTILRWLLDHGAVPVQGSSLEPSPLAIAALHGDTEMVDILLAHHACVRDETALSFAMTYSQEAFETLLSAFVSRFPKGLPGFGSMLLNKAMHDVKVHQIKRLLEAGMDPNTPVRTYFGYESYQIEHLHEERKSAWSCRLLDENALLKRIKKLSPLGYAISMDIHGRLNRINMVRMILEAGADPNRYVGNYPRQTSFLLAVEEEDMDIIRLLVEFRADVNLRLYGMRYSPLQQACQQGSLDVVMFLLQQGADVQAAPSPAKGGTALQMASRSGNVKLAQLLIDNGADVHEPPAQTGGRTSFEGAAEEGRIMMLEFLWDQACPAGFPRAELERARSFAEEECHRGCVEDETYEVELLHMVKLPTDYPGGIEPELHKYLNHISARLDIWAALVFRSQFSSAVRHCRGAYHD
ncbi:Ankyrin repeat-containing domain protein [Apiospora arundinis]|uniref:Ankyrin repeat-containing domain protein n=1 Tax=Apiospora arundinis TaxID=335852 RepID=A0ABR2ISH3_9PEZI